MEESKEIKSKKCKSYKGKYIFTLIILIISIIVNISLIISINGDEKPCEIIYNGIEKDNYYNRICVNITMENKTSNTIYLQTTDFSVDFDGQRITAYKISSNKNYLEKRQSVDVVIIFDVTNAEKLDSFYFKGIAYFEI